MSRGDTVGIAGAGAFGTALANLVAGAGRDAVLWSLDKDVVAEINEAHKSEARLPGVTLSPRVSATTDAGELCRRARLIVVAVASTQVAARARMIGDAADGNTLLVHAIGALAPSEPSAPGLAQPSPGDAGPGDALPSEVLLAETPTLRIGALAGPALPSELCQGRYASMVCASSFDEVTQEARRLLGAPPILRVYRGTDLAGVELSAALAGAYTVALGMADALGVGPVPRAVLITRAAAEAARLVAAAGGNRQTFFGLAGLGNLLVRAASETGPGSRDYRLGRDIGGGAAPSVSTEGARAALALNRRAEKLGVRTPVLAAIGAVLTGKLSPERAAAAAGDTVAAAE